MEKWSYHSKTLARTFNSQEWTAYLATHPDSAKEAIVVHNGFSFNVHGVCVTPKVYHEDSERGWGFRIFVAQSPNGKWDANSHSFCGANSRGGLPSFIDIMKNGFDTEKEAVESEINSLILYFQREGQPAAVERLQRLLKPQQVFVQLCLF